MKSHLLKKSKNVLGEKSKMSSKKFALKWTNTFTIIAMNFVQEQLKMSQTKTALENG